jgi:hypothetical protein
MIYTLYAALAATGFLIALNSFLRGAKKQQIRITLSLIYAALIAYMLFVFGWRLALPGVALSLITALAARAAARIFAWGAGQPSQYVGLPSKQLAKISAILGKPHTPEDFMQSLVSGDDSRERALNDLLALCENGSATQAVMKEFGASREALHEIYSTLLRGGAGQWRGGHYVAASAIAYPDTLRYLLTRPLNDRNSIFEASFMMLERFERGAILSS